MPKLTLPGLFLVASGIAQTALAQRVDTTWALVHGHRMHLVVTGGAGPTVVLEAGATSTHRTWERLRQQLDPSIRVVAYDRPGFGRSQLCPGQRDATTIAHELRAALTTAGIAPPYLLVGWSAGGLFTRVFASAYPTDVVGLLLLDPSPEDFYEKAERAFPEVYRRLDAVDSAKLASSSPGERSEDDGWDAALAQARRSDAGLRVPVVLLSPPRPDLEELAAIWQGEQRAWTLRQRNGIFRTVGRSGHAVHRDRADTVATVIRDMLVKRPQTP